jgi:hypothetical protein
MKTGFGLMLVGVLAVCLTKCNQTVPTQLQVQTHQRTVGHSKGVQNDQIFGPTGYNKFYDRTGKYEGRSIQRGNRTRYYNREGKLLGSAEQRGKDIIYYNYTGKAVGKVKVK